MNTPPTWRLTTPYPGTGVAFAPGRSGSNRIGRGSASRQRSVERRARSCPSRSLARSDIRGWLELHPSQAWRPESSGDVVTFDVVGGLVVAEDEDIVDTAKIVVLHQGVLRVRQSDQIGDTTASE